MRHIPGSGAADGGGAIRGFLLTRRRGDGARYYDVHELQNMPTNSPSLAYVGRTAPCSASCTAPRSDCAARTSFSDLTVGWIEAIEFVDDFAHLRLPARGGQAMKTTNSTATGCRFEYDSARARGGYQAGRTASVLHHRSLHPVRRGHRWILLKTVGFTWSLTSVRCQGRGRIRSSMPMGSPRCWVNGRLAIVTSPSWVGCAGVGAPLRPPRMRSWREQKSFRNYADDMMTPCLQGRAQLFVAPAPTADLVQVRGHVRRSPLVAMPPADHRRLSAGRRGGGLSHSGAGGASEPASPTPGVAEVAEGRRIKTSEASGPDRAPRHGQPSHPTSPRT